ncbi:hypothetical protein KKH36_03265 [Patescibacteria group bacterium]|nr:hypothetical protein [Patescibacteria group bacterium]
MENRIVLFHGKEGQEFQVNLDLFEDDMAIQLEAERIWKESGGIVYIEGDGIFSLNTLDDIMFYLIDNMNSIHIGSLLKNNFN